MSAGSVPGSYLFQKSRFLRLDKVSVRLYFIRFAGRYGYFCGIDVAIRAYLRVGIPCTLSDCLL
jgi:hypothetical protein